MGELEPYTAEQVEVFNPDAALSDAARERIERSIAANTKTAYTRQARDFLAWCGECDRSPMPATPNTLADYVSHLADLGKAPATIEQAIAAIRTAHRQAGRRGEPDTELALAVLKAHKRDWAESGKRKRQSAPVSLDVLRKIVSVTDPATLAGRRDRVLVVLGFSSMSRRCEISALRINELTFSPDGITVFIRVSKTDQAAAGAEVFVPGGVHPDTDPVRVVEAWLTALAECGVTEGPLLRHVNRWDQLQPGGMSGGAINRRVRTLALRAGLARIPTAHGMRRGGATEAARAGVPVAHIATHGRWSKTSTQVHEYVDIVDKWRDNPMRGIGL